MKPCDGSEHPFPRLTTLLQFRFSPHQRARIGCWQRSTIWSMECCDRCVSAVPQSIPTEQRKRRCPPRWHVESQRYESGLCIRIARACRARSFSSLWRTVTEIRIPDSVKIIRVEVFWLGLWTPAEGLVAQSFSQDWFQQRDSAVLSVPSKIIPEERNYVFNVEHPHFRRIEFLRSKPFILDPRLMPK